MIGVIVSQKDPAGLNIKENLLKKGFKPADSFFEAEPVYQKGSLLLFTTQQELIFAEGIGKGLDVDTIIFASKHKSESGKPTLCCHFPGNWSAAKHGGSNRQLCVAPAQLLKKVYLAMKQNATAMPYDVTLEATHHGPLAEKPCLFIEIGSSEKEWNDTKAGEVIAQTILEAANTPSAETGSIAICIGGNHYCNQFNHILETRNLAVSHICPKHAIDTLDAEMLSQAMKKTVEPADFVLVDWNGLGAYKQKVRALLEKIPWKRTDQV